MIQSIFIGIALLASFFNLLRLNGPTLLRPAPIIWDTPSLQFGATSFPTSLDALTNPSGTDSVATVSHSGQHSNANDALEALEAKLGIGASTPISNSIFVGNGTGSSIWTTFASTTQFYASNFFATASSTLQNFTFLNATGTSATTTNSFSTTASSTNFFTTLFNGAGLSTCQTNNVLTWSGGTFGCEADDTGGSTIVSTTTTANMSSTTVAVAAFNTIRFSIDIPMLVGSGATTSATIDLHFNSTKGTAYGDWYSDDSAAFGGNDNVGRILLMLNVSNNTYEGRYITGQFSNVASHAKIGQFTSSSYATTTGRFGTANSIRNAMEGYFVFNSGNARVSTFEVGTSIPDTFMATGTVITVEASN